MAVVGADTVPESAPSPYVATQDGVGYLMYGDRDSVTPGAVVTAPDGRTFTQGETSTYRKVTLPDVPRPPRYRQDYGPRPSIRSATGEALGHIVTPSNPREDYLGFRVTLRVESECGMFWDITYASEAGDVHQVRRLRHSIEGNG